MPKTKKRRKSSFGAARQTTRTEKKEHATASNEQVAVLPRPSTRPYVAPSFQSVLMSVMAALGCWGIAFTFAVFSTDPNHMVLGGMVAVMALMWSFSCVVRVRRMLRQRKLTGMA